MLLQSGVREEVEGALTLGWGGGVGALARPRQAQCSCQFPGTPTCLRQPRAPEALKGTATLSRLKVGGCGGEGVQVWETFRYFAELCSASTTNTPRAAGELLI